jgi:iron(III) transport system ATP-binding protein
MHLCMTGITIQNLTKRFGTSTVLSQIQLHIEPGELFFLLGPSGCGKTTLLRHIAGFYQPDHGKVLFGEEDVTRVPPHLRDTGMMFQSYALWPHLSVAENVAFGLVERKCPTAEMDQRVTEALERVKMGGLGARRIQQLSGGQQQRVALARALVIRPKVFLLDEPLSNLDAKLRLEMRSEIRRLCKQFGLTGVYVTHDREEALSMGDRLAIMDSGKIIQVGEPMHVYRNPINRMTAEFMGETNFIEGTVGLPTSRPGLVDVETVHGVLRGRTYSAEFTPVQGQPVLLSLRPETLNLTGVADSPNRLTGSVCSASYLGPSVQYEVRLPDGTLVKCGEMNPAKVRNIDDPVQLMMATQDVVILRK